MALRRFADAALWVGIYLFLVLLPLFVLLIGPVPPSRGFWWEFSVALGFAALSMMGIQFALTARFRHATAPYGIDIIYFFHRETALLAFLFITAHVVILFIASPDYVLMLLNPLTAPWRGRAGLAAMLGFGILIATTLKRRRLHIGYDRWRLWHGLLAAAAVTFSIIHIVGVGYYTATPWKRILWTAFALYWIGLQAQVRVVRPWMMLRRPYRVIEVAQERGRSWTLTVAPEGHKGLTFMPGQFAWLTIWKSPFAIEEHPFSFSSSAGSPETLSFTIKELGDFTRSIKEVTKGQKVYIDGPFGSFSIDRHRAGGYAFIAGGIGMAPFMSMLRTLADRGDRRPLLLFYADRTWDTVTFREELEALRERLNLTVVYTLEEPPAGWTGEQGRITKDLLARHLPEQKNGYEYFICGPEPMMEAVERALYRLGVSVTRFHSERFNLV